MRDTETGDRLARAEALAMAAHKGQVDKLGVDYIEHVRAVARAVAHLDGDHQIVALLHDSIEDCPDRDVVSDPIIRAGFGDVVADAVDAMTRRAAEDYFADYLPRLLANPIAVQVKRADLAHNRSRLHLLDAETGARLAAKYEKVARILGD